MRDLFPLEGVPRAYAWGSTTAVQSILGIEPDGSPIAELWFGAHPDDPSPAVGTTLDKLIASDPALLGTDVVSRFGGQLPFLLKILAADKPLSIQVHPTIEQAQAGFDREDAAGIGQGAPNRSYRDRNHKPELLCALTEFEALCGFRPVESTLRVLDQLALDELAGARDLLSGPGGLRAAFTHLLTREDHRAVAETVADRVAGGEAGEFAGALRAIRRAAAEFPGDAGVLVALLLNYVRLAPGEAIYLAPGNVHSYLRGVGVEIMANSDNVLRCGLTPKHVDVDEVLAVTDFSELPEPRWPRGADTFDPPVPDFRLTAIDDGGRLDAVLPAGAPRIVLCIAGDVGVDELSLTSGRAAFVGAGAEARVSGHGTAFVASVGEVD